MLYLRYDVVCLQHHCALVQVALICVSGQTAVIKEMIEIHLKVLADCMVSLCLVTDLNFRIVIYLSHKK